MTSAAMARRLERELLAMPAGSPPAPDERTASVQADSSQQENPDDDRPAIDAKIGDLPIARAAAFDALRRRNNPPRLFLGGGGPVRIERGDDGRARAVSMGENAIRGEMADAALYFVIRGKSPIPQPVAPPLEVVRDVMAASGSPFPPLRAIVHAPVLKRDGTILQDGYDEQTQLFLDPGDITTPTLDQPPSNGQVGAARAVLDELLGEFPFSGDADRAHAKALLLQPFLREHITGPTPLYLIEKPTPGTGATLLAEACTYPAAGELIGAMVEGRDEDEWRKRITTKLSQGPAFIFIDNLRRTLDSAAVASALTATCWEDRLLGTNIETRLAVRCAWIATGNNPTLSNEIARRTVSIRLDAKVDQPWLRDGFRHPDLRGWAKANRQRIILGALVLARAWFCAGRPAPTHGRRLGMYEDWSRVLGGVLEVAGIDGFLGNLAEFYATADVETSAKRGFLSTWLDRHDESEVGTAELFPIAMNSDLNLGDKGERSQKTRLGKELGKLRDVRFSLGEGVSVVVESLPTRQGAAQYRLRRVSA